MCLHDQIILSRTTQNFVFFFPQRGLCPRFRGERASVDFAQKWRASPKMIAERETSRRVFFSLASTSRLTMDRGAMRLHEGFAGGAKVAGRNALIRRHNVNDKMKANNIIHKAS